MKKGTIIFYIVLTSVWLAVLGAGYMFLSGYHEENAKLTGIVEHDIIVDDEIRVYVGQQNRITPYLFSRDGIVETARFHYAPSCESVQVGYDGTITILAVPDEEVYVDITEKNTGAFKRVKLHIIESLESVLGLVAPDGELVSGTQNLIVGKTYALSVVTEPNCSAIADYCTIDITDWSGEPKDVFDIEYDGDKVLFTARGIGQGHISIKIVNAQNEQIHNSTIDFQLSMTDESLTNIVLQQTGKTLLNRSDLEQITSVVIDRTAIDLSGLKALPNLTTIYIVGDMVLSFKNRPEEYCYRVSESLFYEYYESADWDGYEAALMPYDNDQSGLYVVCHSDKGPGVSFSKIHTDYELGQYDEIGYEHIGWSDREGNVITDREVQSATGNGIHVFAVWKPIEYQIVYHVRDSIVTATDTWNYDTNEPLRNISSFSETIERTGYRLAGWTDNSEENIFSSNVTYRIEQSYTQLTPVQGHTIHLYDLWEPIEYTISFDTPGDMVAISNMTVSYGDEYTLPVASRPGYNFVSWSTETGDTLMHGTNNQVLSTTDQAVIVLTPVFEEIQYTIVFDLDGGHAPADDSMVTGVEVVLNYTDQYTLPSLVKEGYKSYKWVCVENGRKYVGTYTISKEFTTACTVTFKAVWVSAEYSIRFDCAGGAYEGQENITHNRYWNDGASLILPTRAGHVFLGWYDKANSVTYTPQGKEWSSNLIQSIDDDGRTYRLTAKWLKVSETIVLSEATGDRNVTLSSEKKHEENINPSFDINSLVDEGYTKIRVEVMFSAKVVDSCYQRVIAYSGVTGKKFFGYDFDVSEDGWQHPTFSFTASMDQLTTGGGFLIRWECPDSWFSDEWKLGETVITITAIT